MPRYTTPRTFVTGETVTAAVLNTEFRDNLEALHDQDRCSVTLSDDQAIADDNWEVVKWTAETFDRGEMHKPHKRSHVLRVNQDGLYLVECLVTFDTNSANIRKLRINRNGGTEAQSGHQVAAITKRAMSAGQTSIFAMAISRASRGDTFSAYVYQNSGDKVDLLAGQDDAFFQVAELGAGAPATVLGSAGASDSFSDSFGDFY